MPVFWLEQLSFFPSDGQGYVRWCIWGCMWAACLLIIVFVVLPCLLFDFGVQFWVLQAITWFWVLKSGGCFSGSSH